MTILKNKIFYTILSFLCAFVVGLGCWFSFSNDNVVYADEEYVWVDLQPGDIVGGKKLRFESSVAYFPTITIIFDNGYGIQHFGIDPLVAVLPGENMSDQMIICEGSYQEEVSDENGDSWWKTEYDIPESFSFVTYGPDMDENGLAIVPEVYEHSFDFLTMKVTNIEMTNLNNNYGVKIQVLMDKDEAIASGRIKGDISKGRSIGNLIFPLGMVCAGACLCMIVVGKNKKRYVR